MDNLEKKLQEKGIRITKNRLAILNIMTEENKPLSASSIFSRLKKENPKLRLSTIYRNLNYFTEKNLVRKMELRPDKNESFFEILGEHHHHLICLNCGEIIPLKCPLKQYEKKVSQKTQYKIIEHQLKLYGICPKCQV